MPAVIPTPGGGTMSKKWIALLALLWLIFWITPGLAATTVEMTWMSIANWYFKIGEKRIMMDAYISRVPGPPFFYPPPGYPGDLYAYTKSGYAVDTASIAKVRDAVLGDKKLDYLLVGHSHFDHSWDTPTWSKMTGAPLIGGVSTCFQAAAQGVTAAQCRSGSGDAKNPIQHFARELYRAPIPDAKGELRAGVGEDYPNGGGNRAFLFTVDSPDGQLAFFVNNSASAFDLDKDIVVDGVNYGSPLANLAAAMKDAGLTHVDAWIGTGGKPAAELAGPRISPKAYITHPWD